MGTIIGLPNVHAAPGHGMVPLAASHRDPAPTPLPDLESSAWSGSDAVPRDGEARPLRSESWITLQTVQAQRLVRGRKAAEGVQRIIGLAGFGTMLKVMWLAARADDPWADWWLIRVHDALDHADQELDALTAHVGQVIARQPGVGVRVATSDEPMRIPLAFSNPYGFRGAYLLSKFDALTCAAITARHMAMIGRTEAEKLIQDGGRHVRRAYLVADGYQCRKVTREDVRRDTPVAQEAAARMGAVPQEVLDQHLRAPLAWSMARRHRTARVVPAPERTVGPPAAGT